MSRLSPRAEIVDRPLIYTPLIRHTPAHTVRPFTVPKTAKQIQGHLPALRKEFRRLTELAQERLWYLLGITATHIHAPGYYFAASTLASSSNSFFPLPRQALPCIQASKTGLVSATFFRSVAVAVL